MILQLMTALITLSFGMIALAMALSILLSMGIQALLLLIERILKIDIRFFVEATMLPGSLLRQAMTGVVASLLGYKVEARLLQGYGKDSANIELVRNVESPVHALFIGLAPMLNLGLILGLLATQSLITPLLPYKAQHWFSFLMIYLFVCVIVSGLPQVENIFFIFQSFIANSPWVIPLTLWGLIMAGITSAFLPRTFALLEFLVYETVLLIYEMRGQEIRHQKAEQQPNKNTELNHNFEKTKRRVAYFILVDD